MTETDWKEVALKAREKLAEANRFIKSVTAPPFVYGVVVNYNGRESVDVAVQGKVMELNYSPDVKEKLAPGIPVRIKEVYTDFGIVLSVVDTRPYIGTGIKTSVEEVLDDGRVIVEDGGKKYILNSSGAEKGDRVIVDSGVNVVLQNLGKSSKRYHLDEVPYVPWDNIGGLEETVELLKETVEEPFVHRDIYSKYGKRPPKGVLLYGPPGCGKTLIAKAIAYNLSQRLNGRGKSNGNGYFLSIKGPELKNVWYGESERGIRELFSRAREIAPSVLFFDEAEALFRKRGRDFGCIDDSLVTQLLVEMDGMVSNDNVILILATNRADIIDPAVLRPGRIDRRIRIPRPDQYTCQQIFKVHLRGIPISDHSLVEETTETLGVYGSCELFSSSYPMLEARFNDGIAKINLGNLASGAMIESIAQRAAERAIKREINGGKSGITREDLRKSLEKEYKDARGLIAEYSKKELADNFRDDLESIFGRRAYSIVDLVVARG